jgi:hypothetical protein
MFTTKTPAIRVSVRLASLLGSAVITAVVLSGIDGLAVSQHAEVALAKAKAGGAEVAATAAPVGRI